MDSIEGHNLILEYSTDIVTVHDVTGGIEYVSPSVEHVLGYDQAELVGTSVFDYVHPEDRESVECAFERAVRDDVDAIQFRVEGGDGRWRWLEATVHGRNADAENPSLVVSSRDVTELKQKERQLNAIIENTRDAIFIKDTEGRYEFINEAGASYFDMTPDEVRGLTDYDLFDAETAERLRAIDERIIRTGEHESCETVACVDGTEHVFYENKFPYESEAGEILGVVGLASDITEMTARERELRRLKEEYEAVFENVQDALFLVTVDGDELRYSRFNPSEELATGKRTEDISGKTPREAFGDEIGSELEANYRQCLERRKPISYEERLDFTGEERVWQTKLTPVIIDDEVVQIVGSARDVTERKRHEETLQLLHDAALRLVDAESPEEVAEITVVSGEEILGFPSPTVWFVREDGSGLELAAGTDEHRRRLAESGEPNPVHPRGGWLWSLFESGKTIVSEAVDSDTLSNDMPVQATVIAPIGHHGVLSCGVLDPYEFSEQEVNLANILARSAATALDELERQEELERQNERLDEFASVVSHDLRNPLTVATLRTELAREEHDGEHLEAIEGALERMMALIEDILTLARRGQTIDETVPVSLASLATEAWDSLETPAGRLELVDDVQFEADPSRVTQILENLFRNALVHGSRGETGGYERRCRNADSASDACVTVRVGPLGTTDEGGSVVDPIGFFVEDDGPGIDPEHRSQVFESGFTTTENGTGFGLAIVQRIAEAHGWHCRVTEGSEGGARFEFVGIEPA
ncbi:PAS domain-containing protein [Haloarchaeobius sp. TZWWS8]|uniref:PAS domain-containing protein n=1 Tax=Haloarchaeobius sp. TZWWS8 TaxID=3446121 RepID=UPI003EBFB55B